MMTTQKPASFAQSFVLRLWHEDLDAGETEWRGRIQRAASGETHYFRDWGELVRCLQLMLIEEPPGRPPSPEEPNAHP